MGDQHYRVESAVSATSSGNLTWEKWPHDVAVALGLAGQRNPLGFALVRFLGGPPSSDVLWNVLLVLATQLIKKGVPVAIANEAAMQGFEFYNERSCMVCHGRGITGITQQPCMPCGGSGNREIPFGPDAVRLAISELLEAEEWMETQLGSRLKKGG